MLPMLPRLPRLPRLPSVPSTWCNVAATFGKACRTVACSGEVRSAPTCSSKACSMRPAATDNVADGFDGGGERRK